MGFASSTQALTTLVVLKHDLTRARGGSRIQPIDCCLTFTPHFRLRRSPHRGRVMRKRPLDSPRPHIVVLARNRPPHIGLAGACRYLTFSLFVGAPLPCTASRRGRYYPFLCSCAFVWLKRMRGSERIATHRKIYPINSNLPYFPAAAAAGRPQRGRCGDFADGFFR